MKLFLLPNFGNAAPMILSAAILSSVFFAQGGFAMQITSPAFSDGDSIPSQYTCDGEDLSPPLAWSDVPEGTREFVLIADDPDAPMGTWVHWVLYNVPPERRELPEGVPGSRSLEDGSVQGVTSFGRSGYGGPCPPGGTHRYFFKLYALDSELALPPALGKQGLLEAIQGHVLAEAQLMGTYKRS